MGVVNGMKPNGSVDKSNLQSMEVWTGTTFAVAATMIQEGLVQEGFRTAEGLCNAIYRDYGYWFQTPEALHVDGQFRAISYMRPLSIWAMQWALDHLTNKLKGSE